MFRNHVSRYLSAYCHDELDPATRIVVRRHLQECAACQAEYRQIEQGAALAGHLEKTAAPASLWKAVQSSLENSSKQRLTSGLWRYALAGCAVLVLIGLGWRQFRPVPSTPHLAVASNQNPIPAQAGKSVENVSASEAGNNDSQRPNRSQTEARELAPRVSTSARSGWEVAALKGAPRIGTREISSTGKLAIGEWLVTDQASGAKISVADIGYVEISPNSRVRLVETGKTEHRISLARGKINAFILAPPRLFVVDTPSATAVDLGCAYTLEVDDSGASLLRVTSGWVSFVLHGSESFIPAGAACATQPRLGVGTPYFEDASPGFRNALSKIDFAKGGLGEIRKLLLEARQQDSLTLWHLLGREKDTEIRQLVYDHLAAMTPPPSAVTRDGILRGDKKMLDLWWEAKIR